MADLFQNSSIPVLEQLVNFTQARHTALAGNIANIDTPGYVARDLSVEDFRKQLREAVHDHRQTSMNSDHSSTALAQVSKNPKSILFHDKSQVGVEHQVTEMVKNRIEHNTALAIMASQFQLLQTAISEKL